MPLTFSYLYGYSVMHLMSYVLLLDLHICSMEHLYHIFRYKIHLCFFFYFKYTLLNHKYNQPVSKSFALEKQYLKFPSFNYSHLMFIYIHQILYISYSGISTLFSQFSPSDDSFIQIIGIVFRNDSIWNSNFDMTNIYISFNFAGA